MLRRRLVLALALLTLGACTTSQAPLLLAPRPSAPLASAAPSPDPLRETVESGAAASETAAHDSTPIEPETAPAPATQPPSPRVLIEPPYSAQGHPRLGTEMATLERDDELFQWALGGSSDPAHPGNRPGYHPATRVVVDVRLLSRAPLGSTKRVERIARSSGYWPLRACFEQAQRQKPLTERAARVRLSLGATGRVIGSRLLEGAERDYARCVLERLRKLDFAPGFSRKLDVEISVKQWPGHAPVPPRAADDAPRLKASEDLRATLQGRGPELEACYRAGLERDPSLWGRLALRLDLDADAVVTDAREVETRFPDAVVSECARRAMIGARLAPVESKQLTIAVRFGQLPAPAPPSTTGAPPELTPPAPASAPPEPPAPAAPPLPPAPVH